MVKELLFTLVVTSLIVIFGFWIERNRDQYRMLYKYRFVIAGVIYFTLLFFGWQGRNS
jgi:hypothetical protein